MPANKRKGVLLLDIKGDYFRFGSVFIKISNQTEIFFLKKKPKPGQTDRFRFGLVFLGQNRFNPVWFGFGSVFPVWLGFFSGFLSVSVRFGFFGFLVIKLKPNRPIFSKI